MGATAILQVLLPEALGDSGSDGHESLNLNSRVVVVADYVVVVESYISCWWRYRPLELPRSSLPFRGSRLASHRVAVLSCEQQKLACARNEETKGQ